MDVAGNVPSSAPSKSVSVGFGIYTGYLGCFYSPETSLGPSRAHVPNSDGPALDPPADGNIQFKRVHVPSDYYLDKVHRDFATGRIVIEGGDKRFDYDLIDLKGRNSIEGTPEAILQDEYLFVANPLPMRTWHYQSTFEMENSIDALVKLWNEGQKSIRSIDEVRNDVIACKIVEGSPWQTGQFSPLIAALISLVLCCFSIDRSAFFVLCALFGSCVAVALRTNGAPFVKYERVYSLVFRIAVGAWIVSLKTTPPLDKVRPVSASPVPGLIRLGCAVIIFIDVVAGDVVRLVTSYWSLRTFSVKLALPGRVLVCEVPGGHEVGQYSESVIGPDLFEQQSGGRRFTLIADADGILIELTPITWTDLPKLPHKDPLRFYSTGTFPIGTDLDTA